MQIRKAFTRVLYILALTVMLFSAYQLHVPSTRADPGGCCLYGVDCDGGIQFCCPAGSATPCNPDAGKPGYCRDQCPAN